MARATLRERLRLVEPFAIDVDRVELAARTRLRDGDAPDG